MKSRTTAQKIVLMICQSERTLALEVNTGFRASCFGSGFVAGVTAYGGTTKNCTDFVSDKKQNKIV